MNKYRFNNSIDEKTGKQKHLHQIYKDGEWKDLTGTSSIIDILQIPLAYWAAGKTLERLGWTHPRPKIDGKYVEVPMEERIKKVEPVLELIKGMDAESFIAILDKAYHAHKDSSDEAKEKGAELHSQLENWVKTQMGKMKVEKFDPRIEPFIEWADKNVKKFIASECHVFSERLWIGGIIDAVAELKDGTLAVIDFKSAKEAYPKSFLQAALYAIQIEENGMFDSQGKHNKKLDRPITSLIVVPFGMTKIEPQIRYNLDEYKRGAEAAVILYRLLGFENNN